MKHIVILFDGILISWDARMEAALITAIGGLIVFILNNVYGELNKRQQKVWENALARCDEQIGKLYAPLENLVEQLDATDDIKKAMVGQDASRAADISKYCYESYFVPIHNKIAKLLEEHLHLLEDKEIPESFIEYYKHVASERVFFSLVEDMEQAKLKGVLPADAERVCFTPHPYPEEPYPGPNFKRTIKLGADKVQARQEYMLKQLRRPRFWRAWKKTINRPSAGPRGLMANVGTSGTQT